MEFHTRGWPPRTSRTGSGSDRLLEMPFRKPAAEAGINRITKAEPVEVVAILRRSDRKVVPEDPSGPTGTRPTGTHPTETHPNAPDLGHVSAERLHRNPATIRTTIELLDPADRAAVMTGDRVENLLASGPHLAEPRRFAVRTTEVPAEVPAEADPRKRKCEKNPSGSWSECRLPSRSFERTRPYRPRRPAQWTA